MKPDIAYEGVYTSEEQGAEAIVKIRNGKLWVELNKKIKVDIQPIFLDAFTISDYNDYIPLIIFERDHFKKIKSFNLSINEARNLIFEKVK